MKKTLSLLCIALMSTGLWAQLDRSNPPQAGPAPEINIGESHQFTLKNGLQVFVVEDHKLPLVSYSLNLHIGAVPEGDAKGYVDMVGQLMRSGTSSRSKAEIDEAVDFIGATLNPHSRGIYAQSLTRHNTTLLELMADVMLNPVFPQEELDKAVKQMETAIQANKNEPSAIASNIASVLRYGTDDPYGAITSEASLAKITTEHLKQYHSTYFRPNKGYLVIVGDITLKDAKKQAKKYFGKWEAEQVPLYNSDNWPTYDGSTVAIANRDGANQSTLIVTHTVDLTPGHADAIKASVMNQILGGGSFNARLFQNLREDKAYTYGAYSRLSNDERIGHFTVSTQVRTSVSDSAVNEILYEMRRIQNERVSDEDLELTKNMMTGSFSRSLEDPQTVANFALNIARYNLPADYYQTYLKKLADVTAGDVQEMANKYLRPENAIIIAVGEADKIAETMACFAADGKVKRYDYYGNEVKGLQAIYGVSAEDVIAAYIEAIGGKEALKGVKDWSQNGTATVQGMELSTKTVQTDKNQVLVEMSMNGQTLSKQIFDGERGKVVSPMGEQELEGEMLKEMKEGTYLFPELIYLTEAYQLELAGTEIIDGQNCYKLVVAKPSGSVSSIYYKLSDGLKFREITSSPSGSTIASYLEWTEVEGVLFPKKINQSMGPQSIDILIESIELNQEPDDSIFAI